MYYVLMGFPCHEICREKLLNEKITVAVSKNSTSSSTGNSSSNNNNNNKNSTTQSPPPQRHQPPRNRFVRPPGSIGGDFDRDRLPHIGGGFGGGGFGRGGGGSLMGPDHPMFGGRGGTGLFPGRLPGARFDPYGPGVPHRGIPRPRRDFRPPGPLAITLSFGDDDCR